MKFITNLENFELLEPDLQIRGGRLKRLNGRGAIVSETRVLGIEDLGKDGFKVYLDRKLHSECFEEIRGRQYEGALSSIVVFKSPLNFAERVAVPEGSVRQG